MKELLLAAVLIFPYDQRQRHAYHLPDEWFACTQVSDCTTVEIPCTYSLAVNRNFKNAAQARICQENDAGCAIENGHIIAACLRSDNPDTIPTCVYGQCMTIIPPPIFLTPRGNSQ